MTLAIRVGARVFAIPLSEVVEIMRPLPVEAWDGPTKMVRGLSVIRGIPVPVIDMGTLLGDSSSNPCTRFVTIRTGERRAALAVEAVLGIRELAPTLRTQMPLLLQDARNEFVEAVGAVDAELFAVLKACRIVPETVWDSLPRQEA